MIQDMKTKEQKELHQAILRSQARVIKASFDAGFRARWHERNPVKTLEQRIRDAFGIYLDQLSDR